MNKELKEKVNLLVANSILKGIDIIYWVGDNILPVTVLLLLGCVIGYQQG